MPNFRHLFKELEEYLEEKKKIEEDPDYQLALVELDNFLKYKGMENVNRRGLYPIK